MGTQGTFHLCYNFKKISRKAETVIICEKHGKTGGLIMSLKRRNSIQTSYLFGLSNIPKTCQRNVFKQSKLRRLP